MQLDAPTSSYGLRQLVNEPNHILLSSSFCIDLIFTDQPSLVVNSGMRCSFHANCYHQITYWKLNLKIEYPPSYQHLERTIHTVKWESLVFNKRVYGQVSIFNNTLINIFFQLYSKQVCDH